MSSDERFKRRSSVAEPGIVGAQWWRESMADAADAAPRRQALKKLISLGVGGAAPLFACKTGDEAIEQVQWRQEERASLDLQRLHGWSFGAPEENLAFAGGQASAIDGSPPKLAGLAEALEPHSEPFRPLYARTLFLAPSALPSQPIAGDSPSAQLADKLVPVLTPEMKEAFLQGAGLGNAFRSELEGLMVVVDLPGPQSVAYAAGLAEWFDPVFYFNNWPHPRGVVPAHMTLGAALYYRPWFEKQESQRKAGNAAMALILDRNRLLPYADARTQFDNRYLAAVPTAGNLNALGVRRIIYVVPSVADHLELDDLNADFVDYEHHGLEMAIIAATDFRPVPKEEQPESAENEPVMDAEIVEAYGVDGGGFYYHYGGYYHRYSSFWLHYRGGGGPPEDAKGKPAARHQARGMGQGGKYVPQSRATSYASASSTGSKSAAGANAARPGLGRTSVAVAATAAAGVAAGSVLGARYGAKSQAGGPLSGSSRSGSFGRASSSGGG